MTPDIRERAERLLLLLQSSAMDGNAYDGDHLSSELALPIISQALASEREAGRAEERERAAVQAEQIGDEYGMDETGWFECSETIAAAIRNPET